MCDQDISSLVDEFYLRKKNEFAEVADFIWTNPELSAEESLAHNFLVKFLRQRGFQVEEEYLGFTTAFRAEFEVKLGSGGPVICVLCEYDALPDVGHACGHNLIAEAGVAAGTCVREYLQKYQYPGKIVIMGCPAEENGSYKVHLLNAGAFDDVDLAMMVHPHFTSNELKTNLTGVSSILAEFQGRCVNACSSPWEGKNALDGVVSSYQSIAMLRQHMHPTCKVHAIIRNGGSFPSVIPDYASLAVLVRAPTVALLEELEDRVKECINAGAKCCDVKATISHPVPKTLPLNSNGVLARIYQKYAEEMGVTFADVTGHGERFSASSDVGSVSWKVPTIQPAFHIDADGPNHSKEFTVAAGHPSAQSPTLIASRAMAKASLEIFKKPELVAEIHAEFNASIKC